MTQPIWYDSTEAGAPTLNNAAGSLLEVLRACLVNGFNARVVTSIAVAAGVATATAATHGFSGTFGKLVQISGAPVAALNGNKQPGNVLTNSFTFPAPGVADGTYTGTISARRAPLGWLEAYTGTNRAIFQRSAPEATNVLLRVLDTAAAPASATSARVLMVRSASDADTFAQQAPVVSVLSGAGGFLHKGPNSVAAKSWALVGDHLGLWLMTPFSSSGSTQLNLYHFGDLNPLDAVDNNRAVLFTSNAEYDGSFTNADVLRNANPAGNTHSASVSMASRDGSVVGQGVLPWGAWAYQYRVWRIELPGTRHRRADRGSNLGLHTERDVCASRNHSRDGPGARKLSFQPPVDSASGRVEVLECGLDSKQCSCAGFDQPHRALVMAAVFRSFATSVDTRWFGAFRIAGSTRIAGVPEVPVRRRVRLHDQITGLPVREVWSNEATGAYSFERISPGTYYVTAFDHTGQYGGVVETDLTPEPMP